MGNLIGSFIVGILIGGLIGFLYFIYKDSFYRTDEQEKKDIITSFIIALVVTIVTIYGVMMGMRVSYASRISNIKAVQQSYLDSLQSSYITDLQKVSVANQIATLNGDIAELKYRKSQWYGFDIPNSIYEIDIIDLKEIGEK